MTDTNYISNKIILNSPKTPKNLGLSICCMASSLTRPLQSNTADTTHATHGHQMAPEPGEGGKASDKTPKCWWIEDMFYIQRFQTALSVAYGFLSFTGHIPFLLMISKGKHRIIPFYQRRTYEIICFNISTPSFRFWMLDASRYLIMN